MTYTALTHFMPLAFFYTPWKHQKTSGFLIFSGGIERDQWHELGKNLITLMIYGFKLEQKRCCFRSFFRTYISGTNFRSFLENCRRDYKRVFWNKFPCELVSRRINVHISLDILSNAQAFVIVYTLPLSILSKSEAAPSRWVLTKTRNDLKWPETTYNEQETT